MHEKSWFPRIWKFKHFTMRGRLVTHLWRFLSAGGAARQFQNGSIGSQMVWCEALSSLFAPGGPFGQNQGVLLWRFFSSSNRFSHGPKGLQKQKLLFPKGFELWGIRSFNDFSVRPRDLPKHERFWTDFGIILERTLEISLRIDRERSEINFLIYLTS